MRAAIVSLAAVPLLALFASTTEADTAKYTTSDIEKLVADGAYADAISHADDIAPTQRDAKWLEATSAAAAGWIGGMTGNDAMGLAMIDELDAKFPQLLKVAKYTTVRASIGKSSLAGCYANMDGDACLAYGTRLVDRVKDPALTLAVAKITRTAFGAAASIGLFKRVATPAVCKDADLGLAVLGALDAGPETAIAADGRAVMTTCWDAVHDAVVKTFGEATKGSNIYKNTCDTLKAKGLLSPLQTKRCTK